MSADVDASARGGGGASGGAGGSRGCSVAADGSGANGCGADDGNGGGDGCAVIASDRSLTGADRRGGGNAPPSPASCNAVSFGSPESGALDTPQAESAHALKDALALHKNFRRLKYVQRREAIFVVMVTHYKKSTDTTQANA
jgi:hypothetical protein